MIVLDNKNALIAHRINISNRKDITFKTPKRFINSLVTYKGTITKLGRYIQPEGLNMDQQQMAWRYESLVKDNQIPSFINSDCPSAKMEIKTIQNGRETTELPENNSIQELEKFKTDVEQLVDTAGNGSTNEVKALYENFSNEVVTHLNNLWVDSIAKFTEIDNFANFLGAKVSLRLISPLSNHINITSRNYILDHLYTNDNLHVITIDRFEIFVTNMGSEPFYQYFLPIIHNLIININSYEFCGYELYNASYWVQNKFSTSEDFNNWLIVKSDLIFEKFYSSMNELLELSLFLGEGHFLPLPL